MADQVEIDIKGLDQLNAAISEAAAGFGDRAGSALRAEAELIMTEAKKLTPVLTGTLRESGHVTGPVRGTGTTEVGLVFGGPAASYAVYVHENQEAHHSNGEAKFLEKAVNAAARDLPARLAARLHLGEEA